MSTKVLRRSPRAPRKTDRQDAVAHALRERIVRGELSPGSRLPNRVEIEQNFAASSITVQKALECLKEEGFVVASRRSGTFVAEQPPHLADFALVFLRAPGDPAWSAFWQALRAAAREIEARGERRLPVYFGVDGHEDSEDYQRLVRAVCHRRLAGMIFTSPPDYLKNTPLMTAPNLPRVAIMSGACAGLPIVSLDADSLCEKALDCLAARGCRRIAVLKTGGLHYRFEAAIAARGMETRPYWIQDASLYEPQTARGVVHLLMNPSQRERPDGLFIANDNLLQAAALGLNDAGVRVPHDLKVVAHGNFPLTTASPLAALRMGFDVRRILDACLNVLDRQRTGKRVPARTMVPAWCEEESTEET
jgi:DNA-binding LacI/PurR family transcriptional regulator